MLKVQEAFDVRGPFWWLRWLLPSIRQKQGSARYFPTDVHGNTRHAAAGFPQDAGL